MAVIAETTVVQGTSEQRGAAAAAYASEPLELHRVAQRVGPRQPKGGEYSP